MSLSPRSRWTVVTLIVAALVLLAAQPLGAGETDLDPGGGEQAEVAGTPPAETSSVAWWVWPLVLLVFCFVLGIVAVVAGIGGGVLFVPLVSSLFPFHIDFVRATGLLMALAGALAAGPGLLKRGLASMRLVLPCALMASIGSIVGAGIGLRMGGQQVQLALGGCILLVVLIMLVSRNVEFPAVARADRLSRWLGIGGVYPEAAAGGRVPWRIHRLPLGLLMFVGVGFLAGMFGLGAGWANVPVLNLVLGVPLKLAVGSSVFMLSITAPAAVWVYLRQGCWMPLLALPSIVGLMLGTSLGVKVLGRSRPRVVRYVVIAVMVVAAVRSILKGSGVWT